MIDSGAPQPAAAVWKEAAGKIADIHQSEQAAKAIVFACDENYAPYLPVVIQSLADNTPAADNYQIIIMNCCADSRDKEFAAALDAIEEIFPRKKNFSLKIIELRPLLEQHIFLRANKVALKRYGYASYARILIPDLLSNYEKALYLDIDHIILADIAELFNVPIGDRLIAAVPDINATHARLKRNSERKQFIEGRLGLSESEYYIVASPIMFNIQACAAFKFSDKVLALLSEHNNMPFPDQDAINAVCKGRIFYLPQKWGRLNDRCFDRICRFIRKNGTPPQIKTILGSEKDSDDIKLLHYVATPKPWSGRSADYADIWHYYAAKTKNRADLLLPLLFSSAPQSIKTRSETIYRIFGLPLFKAKVSSQEKQYFLGNIPIMRLRRGKENSYIYICGIKIISIHKQ